MRKNAKNHSSTRNCVAVKVQNGTASHIRGEPSIQRELVGGARRVWGTLRSATQSSVKNTILNLAKIEDTSSIQVKRKFKSPQNGKPRWWFVLHGDDNILKLLESEWQSVSLQTGWRIELCYKPVETVLESGESNNIGQDMLTNSNVSPPTESSQSTVVAEDHSDKSESTKITSTTIKQSANIESNSISHFSEYW